MVLALAGLGLQAAGSYTQGVAAKREAAQQSALAHNYQGAYSQYSGWQQDADQGLAAHMHDLSQQGYANYDQLGQALGSSQRQFVGMDASGASDARLRSALSGTPQMQAPANAPSPGYAQWGANTMSQRYQPMEDSRMALINQQAGQRGMAQYDRNALGQAADTGLDLGRQGAEAQQRENALAAYRKQILEGAQVRYQYNGPSPASQNAQLYGQGLNLAGSAAMAYGQRQS